MKHIYIHFPFCLKKCHYCDFASQACSKDLIPYDEYVRAVIKEFEGRKDDWVNQKIKTVYFGGGTPSLMRPEDVQRIIQKLDLELGFESNPEITLECNPGTVNADKIQAFTDAGVNRFSVGIQSFNDKYLKLSGRIHEVDEARSLLGALDNVSWSADLIYGYPGQSLEEWKLDLEAVLSYPVSHLSCYALTREKGTVLDTQMGQGLISDIDLDEQAKMQAYNYECLAQRDLPAYEISNFSQPGFESKHNLAYWHYRSFLGLGPNAVGQLKNTRYRNDANIRDYLAGKGKVHVEEIDEETAKKEFLMMGLRVREGVPFLEYQNLFQSDLLKDYSRFIALAVENGWLEVFEDRISPTYQGFLMNDALVKLFF